MKLAIICFSLTGCATAEKLKQAFEYKTGSNTEDSAGAEVCLAKKSRYIPDAEPVHVDEWTREQFAWADGIIFVGACGIAVRHIAPYICSKKTDPAVLVVDECGKFVISLLSGHLGGANELADRTAKILGAIPVVTTATDLHHCFAVDVFARKNNCEIFNMKAAREVSAALLAGKKVGFYSDFPWDGELPEGLVLCDKQGRECLKKPLSWEAGNYDLGIAVSSYKNRQPFASTVAIVPRNLVLGMGCRRGKCEEAVQAAAMEAVKQNQIYQQAISRIVSIDLKKEEQGLISLAQRWKIPFETFSQEELERVKGDFTPSSFVKSVTGVDNVCERSAVLGSSGGKLIQKKNGRDGVTTALAAADWRIHFE